MFASSNMHKKKQTTNSARATMPHASDEIASEYANERGKQREFRFEFGFVQKHLERNKKTLDLMCGPGRFLVGLTKAGYDIEGIDLSPNMIDEAREYARTRSTKIQVSQQDGAKLSYSDGEFNQVIVMGDSIGAITTKDARMKVLDEIARITSKNGRIVLVYGSAISSVRLFGGLLVSYLVEGLIHRRSVEFGDKRYRYGASDTLMIHHYYLSSTIQRQLRDRSFTVQDDIPIPQSDKRIVIAEKI